MLSVQTSHNKNRDLREDAGVQEAVIPPAVTDECVMQHEREECISLECCAGSGLSCIRPTADLLVCYCEIFTLFGKAKTLISSFIPFLDKICGITTKESLQQVQRAFTSAFTQSVEVKMSNNANMLFLFY